MSIIGLTGGIGMGKTTVGAMLRRLGAWIFDADAVVHRLQAPGGRALPAIGRLVPDAVRDGRLDRVALRRAVVVDPALFRALEAIIHPMVFDECRRFLRAARRAHRPMVVLDIPLLYEAGMDRLCDRVIAVSAPCAVQRARVLARGHMTPAQVDAIIARQMDDRQRRARADHVIYTGLSRALTWRQVHAVVALVRREQERGRR
ncbi:dephospho-CoA kinase [Novacetimonas hansenii]|uniref:dephospho-CoA kinase n=1 Tax=Novacetimonas hansenii TaxID=436 RepID=UPI000789AD52|nr:dephospho-CoA kinase [Novacetimonas hansenii]RFP05099.1 dephospho-CoA kinase [Novacetimonas hansenii]WEQ59915.1 dephospho-CoA kinase [Novacetimonas hansenii]CUW46780.1 Dephospho-CoA kinase [Novacetimonas hansenii]